MDMNPIEIAGKTLRRTYETVEDTCNLAQCALFDLVPGRPIYGIKQDVSESILNAGRTALRHGDVTEAEHQLNRELYFSSMFDDLAGSENEAAAHAGLNAIKQGKSAKEISTIVEVAAIENIKAALEDNRCPVVRPFQYPFEKAFDRPELGHEAAKLAQVTLACSEFNFKHGYPKTGKEQYDMAVDNLDTASFYGEDVSVLKTYLQTKIKPLVPKTK